MRTGFLTIKVIGASSGSPDLNSKLTARLMSSILRVALGTRWSSVHDLRYRELQVTTGCDHAFGHFERFTAYCGIRAYCGKGKLALDTVSNYDRWV
jgi:hypothetical protein